MNKYLFFVSLLTAFILPVKALPVTVDWPPGTTGAYTIRGITKAPATATATYEVPDGTRTSITGPGFRVDFEVRRGAVEVAKDFYTRSPGVRFEEKSNTFFVTSFDVQVEVKDFSGAVGIDKAPAASSPPEQNQHAKLTWGHHTLVYGTNKIGFHVEVGGVVTLVDDVAGITALGSIISVQGLPLQVSGAPANWTISPLSSPAAASGSIQVLPGEYIFQAGKQVHFSVDNRGLLALNPVGPFAEVINLQDNTGASLGQIAIPDGAAKQTARLQQEKTDRDLHDKILASSATASWKLDFTLKEKMQLWNFSEQQLSYPVELPASVSKNSLKLLAFTDQKVRSIPFQLSSSSPATIAFRTDLPKASTRLFRLVSAFDAAEVPQQSEKPPALTPSLDGQQAVLDNGLIYLKVPAGHRDYAGAGMAFSKVPPPLLGIAREAQPKAWPVAESLAAPEALMVTSMDAHLVESGPVFGIYQVDYQLSGGRTYTTQLELRAGESHVKIAESTHGFTPADQAFLHLDYGKGMLDPDRRMAAAIDDVDIGYGYARYSGAYDRNVSHDDHSRPWFLSKRWLDYDPKLDDSKDNRLDIRLGLYIPNTLGVIHAAAFYKETGNDALLLSIDRPEDWKTYERYVWTDYRSIDNLRFYSQDGRKYMAAGIAGEKRYWALGLIPRSDYVMRAESTSPAGPEVWLSSELGNWNLQAQKDRMSDWEEKLDTPVPPDAAHANADHPTATVPLSYADFDKNYLSAGVVHQIQNFLPFHGGMNGRSYPELYVAYVQNRSSWTPEQRERVREILVFLTDYNDGDDYLPHHGMLGGHPNFLMDAKENVAIGLATFPNHPKAKYWHDSLMSFFDELFDKYERKDVPELNTKGGRWTENIACYWGQSMNAILNSELSLKSYDGTTLAKNSEVFGLIRWMRDAFMSPNNGERLVPPEGAHSNNFAPGTWYWKSFFQLCRQWASGDPKLASEMLWIETSGKEGTLPDVHSVLYTDYGVIFHHDFGGPHESYAHMQDINGMSYRWGYAGILYYGAQNKVWSYNGREANGDIFDWTELTAYTTGGNGLTVGPTDQLLYDFDFAQFYRQTGKEDDAYRARGVMLLRDDYLVVSDEVKSPDVKGIFRWVNFFPMPEIHQLKPGAPKVESTFKEEGEYRGTDLARIGHRQEFTGKGDFLTVVAPSAVTATATSYGATVNGEYVFASQKPVEVNKGTVRFSGTYGYARPNQLALFQGTQLGLDGFELRREGGDFGFSGSVVKNQISGRIVGRKGGKIFIVPPTGFDLSKAAVVFDGQTVPHTVQQGAITFTIEIAQRDGLKNYVVTF